MRGLCRRGAGPRAGCGRHRQSGRPDDRRRRPRGAAQTRHGSWEYPLYMIQYTFRRLRIRRHDRSLHERLSGPAPRQVFVATAKGEYHGVRTGITPTSSYADSEDLSRVNCTNNDNIMWMTPAESMFLRAAYELRWGSESDAATYYAEGIRTSFSTLGASGAEGLHRRQGADTRQLYRHGHRRQLDQSPLASIPICWKAGGDFETHLEQIITQKYLAHFPKEEACRNSAEVIRASCGPRQQQWRQDLHLQADPPLNYPRGVQHQREAVRNGQHTSTANRRTPRRQTAVRAYGGTRTHDYKPKN